MTQPIDVAYVDVVVRDKSLRQVKKDIKDTLDDVDKDLEKTVTVIEDHLGNVFTNIDKHFDDTSKIAHKTFSDIDKEVERTFTRIGRDVPDSLGRLQRAFRGVRTRIGNAFDELGDVIERGLQRIGRGIGSVIGLLGQLGGAIFSLVSSNPLIFLIAALIPPIIALAAALSNLVGLVGVLPAGIGVLAAAIIPLVVAFQGFGDAVAAVASGDVEKIDKALKNLSPSAQLAARELGNLLPVLTNFRKAVQEAFFSRLGAGSITALVGILPQIVANFSRVGGSLGDLGRQLIGFLTSLNSVNAINDVFNATANIVDKLGGPLIRIFNSLALATSAGLPFVERIAAALGRALDALAAFIDKALESGDFNKFVEDAFTTVKELVDLLKAVGGLIGTIFAGTEKSGHDLIKTLTDVINGMDEFFKSAQGQRTLQDLVLIVNAVGQAIEGAVVTIGFLIFALHNSLDAFEFLGRSVAAFIGFLGELLGQVPAKLQEFGDFLSRIPDVIANAIRGAFDRALILIGAVIGLILFTVQELPNQIAAFLVTLPNRVGIIFTQLKAIVITAVTDTMTSARDIFINGFNEVVNFIGSVPDRIRELIPMFGHAGKNLIESFMNGFRSVGSFIGDVAGDIVGAVKSFLNKAIDRINSGIASIDAILPGDLGRIPRLAQGALVRHTPGGILANVGEGSEDEVVAPLSKLTSLIRGAVGAGGGVNFASGSINVNFSGAVPSEGEAFVAGRAVGNGIADQLARRSVRVQMRAV